MLSGLEKQLPFAYSVAINKTVNASQSAVQAALPGEFTLRRADFVKRTIYRKPGQDFATKTNLVGAVRVNPERNVLAKFEDDTTKRSIAGHKLAVPLLRLGAPNIIIGRGDPLSVKRLMAAIKSYGGRVVKASARKGQLRVSQVGKAFLVESSKGTFIVQRTGPAERETRLLYEFREQVPITSHRLHFDEIAMQAALASWEKNFDEAIAFAIETMR